MGYNWQASNYVFGLEGSITGMKNRGTVTNSVFGLSGTMSSTGGPTIWPP